MSQKYFVLLQMFRNKVHHKMRLPVLFTLHTDTLDSCESWSKYVIWYLVSGLWPIESGLWLVDDDHVTWILACDWLTLVTPE